MLIDASGLIAILDRDDPDHSASRDVLSSAPLPLRTTWAAMAEASHIARRRLGPIGPAGLLGLVRTRAVTIEELSDAAVDKIATLMERYGNLPMDLADATLVHLAELRDDRTIITHDHHFHVYRVGRRRTFSVLP